MALQAGQSAPFGASKHKLDLGLFDSLKVAGYLSNNDSQGDLHAAAHRRDASDLHHHFVFQA